MSRHAHKWEIDRTEFSHSRRVFSILWICTQGRCIGTKTVELKPLRKPSKDARTDEEVHERQADRKLQECKISFEVAGWPEGTDEDFDHLLNEHVLRPA